MVSTTNSLLLQDGCIQELIKPLYLIFSFALNPVVHLPVVKDFGWFFFYSVTFKHLHCAQNSLYWHVFKQMLLQVCKTCMTDFQRL